jgi:hypothetical protein
MGTSLSSRPCIKLQQNSVQMSNPSVIMSCENWSQFTIQYEPS